MMELSIKYLVCIKEEKDPELYKQFIEKVVQHISALDTSVRDVQADDVLVTIKDSSCKFVTGADREESEDDDDDKDTISPYDVINTGIRQKRPGNVKNKSRLLKKPRVKRKNKKSHIGGKMLNQKGKTETPQRVVQQTKHFSSCIKRQ